MSRHFLGELFSKLDMLVLKRMENSGTFEVLGQRIPDWIKYDKDSLPHSIEAIEASQIIEQSHFLPDFLESEADPFWKKNEIGELSSRPWSEQDFTHEECQLEATAIAIGKAKILIIKKLGYEFAERKAWVQKERDRALETRDPKDSVHAPQVKSKGQDKQDENNQGDFVMMLNKLLIGVMVIDQDGSITFVNETSRRLLGLSDEDIIGRLWQEVAPFTENYQKALMDLMKKPFKERDMICVNIVRKNDSKISLKLDVHDDPQNPLRKILFLYNNPTSKIMMDQMF